MGAKTASTEAFKKVARLHVDRCDAQYQRGLEDLSRSQLSKFSPRSDRD